MMYTHRYAPKVPDNISTIPDVSWRGQTTSMAKDSIINNGELIVFSLYDNLAL
ncbi:hypothetical protein U0035_14860 [Niabella yanshanensis]|uniref:Uncharacterized protein n=1 Tax=Niabella yanshanensis TaxID=577386 RepID=A0ABZ0W194_9BACT|nr:hypothetical protein [Niabella yanshanensis]WQD36951.1 hypothetical protein U0035_14860 [Niabella yanshanensis]